MNFENKVVLISGATGGMGEEIAKQLGKEKAKLALFARREEKLKEIAEKIIESNKTECIYKKCDVKKIDDIKNAIKFTKEKYGKIDIAILTAGVLIPNPIETFDASIIKNSMDINFMGSVYFIENLFPIMRSQGYGTIAVTSTLPDKRGIAGWGAYGASKAAISWLVESLRAEAKQKYNINFITIKPGTVDTPMVQDYERPGAVSPQKAAEIIIKGIKKGKREIEFPLGQVLLIKLKDLFPPWAYDMIPVEMQKGGGYPNPEVRENNKNK